MNSDCRLRTFSRGTINVLKISVSDSLNLSLFETIYILRSNWQEQYKFFGRRNIQHNIILVRDVRDVRDVLDVRTYMWHDLFRRLNSREAFWY